jgi:hypothetical protein
MPGPPPPKPKGQDDLAEVERALSVLQGRDPEFERARRQDEEARAKRRAQIDQVAHSEAGKIKKRRLVIGAVALVLAGIAVFAGSLFRTELERRGRIERAGERYRAAGFTTIETSGRGAPGTLESTPDKGCLVAVSTGEAPIKVARASGDAIVGKGPVVLCVCAPEKLTVTSKVDKEGGLALLRVESPAIGGSKAFAFLPFEPGTTGTVDDACAEQSHDAWIGGKRYPAQTPPEGKWLKEDPKRAAAFEAAGFTTIGGVAPDRPFGVVDLPKESCVIAVGKPGDSLTLRLEGGATPIAKADTAFAWCAAGEQTAVVERAPHASAGEVTVIAAPAARIGGTVGLEEILELARLKIPEGSIAVPHSDHAWNAKQLLVASAVPEGLVTTAAAPDIPVDNEARLASVSFGAPKALVAVPGDEVFSFCEPLLTDTSLDSMCVFSGPHAWKISNSESVGGVARAKLPFWLFGLQDATEPAAMKVAADLVTFTRRMRRLGFEPTAMEAMTETPNGVDVLGRANEDAVIALGLAPEPPWLFPYADDAKAAWSITTGEPRVVPVKVLEKVKLVTTTRGRLPPKETRRTVVYRRQVKKS